MTTVPVFVVGAGGHARVLLEMLELTGRQVLGLTDPAPDKRGASIHGHVVLGSDELLEGQAPGSVELVNGIGSTNKLDRRAEVFQRFKAKGFRFATVVHPAAVVSRQAQLGEGVQVMAGAIVQTGCRIGPNTIVNTRASIDHDCWLGTSVHVAPGATLSGGVQVGDLTHIGVGATVVQSIVIGRRCLVGAGAVVLRDVPDQATVFGVPARRLPGSKPSA